MTAKVKVDLKAGTLEAEGSEEFIRELYREFREQVTVPNPVGGRGHPEDEPPSTEGTGANGTGGTGSKRRRSGNDRRAAGGASRDRSPVLVKDLDLVTKGDRVGLKDFMKQFKTPSGALNLNALFVYYLSRVGGVAPISIDHVYTCYKHAGARVPQVLTQSLWDTARRKGTIDTSSLDDIRLTTAGENWVEHDLEKASAE